MIEAVLIFFIGYNIYGYKTTVDLEPSELDKCILSFQSDDLVKSGAELNKAEATEYCMNEEGL